MADTLIEQTRGLHQDVEKLERIIVKDLKQEMRTHKEKLMQNHRVRKRVQDMQQAARKLLKIYEDEDRSRKEEIDALGGEDKVFSRFYDRLKEVRDYHRRFPTLDITEAEKDDELLKEEVHVEFTGEEGMGRYLDLHEHYQRFVNGKFGRQLEYLDYLGVVVSDFGAIPRAAKFNRQYKEYLEQLLAYLTSFYERTLPLGQLRKQLQKVEDELRAAWEQGQAAGWEDRGMGQLPTGGGIVDLEAFESAEELETIGAERLKEALQALGLKCGGTPRERAERLFSTKGKPQEALDKKLFSKATAPAVLLLRSEEDAKKQQAAALQIALLEAQVAKLGEVLAGVLAETKGRVEKKQAQTYEEMQAEQEEAEHEAAPAEDDDEEDDYIYNPLKLPLGWDGKPIPYWLYKLHGLNQEFKCEICGNYSYWGRRAYEKHFKEWRHQNGMRALGIPNNKNFFEVTRIEEALALWKAMQERQKGGFRADLDEEFEDASGNVYNRKTYEDMKRQGLL